MMASSITRGIVLLILLSCLGYPGPIAAAGTVAEVRSVGGLPTFVINGKPHSGICYSSYDCRPEFLTERVKQFNRAGCDIFNFVVEISGYGYSKPMWTARDRWDFSDLDARARAVLTAAPTAYLLPRIYIDAPEWWRNENRSELILLSNGSTSFGEKLFALPRAADYASIASEKWRADMRRALGTVIEHIESSDYGSRVIGYQLSGQKTEEWYHWSMSTELLGDYSPAMLSAFRTWLGSKYRTDGALRKAWNQPGTSLRTATIPSQEQRYGNRHKTFRDPATERAVIDFQQFWSAVMADTIAYFAQTVKEKVHRQKLVGAFYGYSFEFTDLAEDAGHLALGRLLRSPDLDFVMAPSSYYNRNLPGTPYFRAPVASVNLRGKVFWNDFDQVSFKYYDKLKENPALKQWEYQMGLTRTAEEFAWMNRREVGMELAQGVQLAHFDIHGGYYEDPVVMEEVRALAHVRQDSLYLSQRSANAQILVLMDEDSEHYLTFRSPVLTPLLSGQLAAMGFVAPYDALLLSDLPAADTARYRLAIVLNAVKLDPQQRRLIRNKLAGKNRTILWLHAPGICDGQSLDAKHMEMVTGMRILPDTSSSGSAGVRFAQPDIRDDKQLRTLPGDQFSVEDPGATPLAWREGSAKTVVVATKKLHGWTSVYSAAAPLPAAFVRRLAQQAGVHLYTEGSECLIFANENYLMLAAPARQTTETIHLPGKATVTDAISNEGIANATNTFQVNLRPKEVRLFKLQSDVKPSHLPPSKAKQWMVP